MAPSEIEQRIQEFMSKTFLFEFGSEVNADTDLFEAGLIDSFGFVELVSFLEGTFEVKFSDDDLASPETSTLSGIARTVRARQGVNRDLNRDLNRDR